MATPGAVDGPTDAELVQRALDGDREAFAEIYRRYHRVVYRFARMMSGSASLAEDVTQDTFMALLRDLRRYQPERAGLSTYLYGAARNLTRSRLRRDVRFVRLEPGGGERATGLDPSAALEDTQARQRLRQAIMELPSRYREVVILCAIHGLTYAEAAAVLRTPIGTVRSRLSRAKQAMAVRLRDMERSADTVPGMARCVV